MKAEPLSITVCWPFVDQIHVVTYFMVFVVLLIWSLINREHRPPSSVLPYLSVGWPSGPGWFLWFPPADCFGPETHLSL